MRLTSLWLKDFRSYTEAHLEPAPDGLTVVIGANGQGKTNLLEAVAWLATLSSFRGVPNEALVRVGAPSAILRATGQREERELLLEAELPARGPAKVQVNRQRPARTRELLGALRVTVFSPDDLALVKGGPQERRRLLDEGLVSLAVRYDALVSDVAKVLKQRGALLKGIGPAGKLDESAVLTLDVFDAQLARVGAELGRGRRRLVDLVAPAAAVTYDRLAGRQSHLDVDYQSGWGTTEGDLLSALAAGRTDDLRRGHTGVGPHRDEVVLRLDGLPSRTHASQGEQRTVALALRLAIHEVVAERAESPPILLLDDVFSELDPQRTEALVAHLPPGQALLTTAGEVPAGVHPATAVRVDGGRLVPV